MKVFVDTSALLAALDAADRYHREAVAALRHLPSTNELITHNYVHLEAHALVRRRLGREAASDLVDGLLPGIQTIWVDEATHRSAVEAHRADGGSVSLVDQVSFVVMRREGIGAALAFDRDFEARGFLRPPTTAADEERPRLSESPAPYGAEASATDLVSVAEVAARSGRSVHTIQSWRRRHRDFPAPVASLATGPVWTWPIVERWIRTRRVDGRDVGRRPVRPAAVSPTDG